ASTYRLVLFNDALMYAVERGGFRTTFHVQHVLRLEGLSVTPLPGPKFKQRDFFIRATASTGATVELHLACATPPERDEWVRDTRRMLSESLEARREAVAKSAKVAAMLGVEA